MNILFTAFSYYPQISGVPIVVQYLAEGLLKLGHKVSVVTRKNGLDLKSKETLNGVDIYRFNIGQDLFKRNIGDVGAYINFVLSFPKDVLVLECVQCHTTDVLLPHLKYMNCKILLHSHGGPGVHQNFFRWTGDIIHTIGNTDNWRRYKYYYGSVLPDSSKFIDGVICLSLCASDLEYMNKTMKKVFILGNAANDIFFDETYYNKDISDIIKIKSSKYILCISNYIANKCQIDIIKSFAKLKDPDCALVMIGSKQTAYYKKVKLFSEKIREEKGKEILLLSNIDRNLFPSIISRAHLFVMASRHEEYPLSLVEAMACGTPFLSTNAGCSRLLPGGATVVDRDDFPVFMNVMVSDRTILKRLSMLGKLYAKDNCTVSCVVNQFDKILSVI